MSWEIARQNNYNALKRFIIQREWACTPFSSRLKTLKLKKLIPGKDMPGKGLPGKGLPGKGLPGKGLPGKGLPGKGLPGKDLPDDLLSKALLPGADCMVLIHHNSALDMIEDALMLTNRGLIFPVFRERFYPDTLLDLDPIRQLLCRYIPKLHSVIGLASDVEKITQLLPRKPFEQIDYYLMTLTTGQLPGSRLTGNQSIPGQMTKDGFSQQPIQDRPDAGTYKIREADVRDAEKLYTLQKNYEIEEVFLNPARFDSRVCFLNLKKTLKKELVFYIEKDGVALAKAGTNARGFFTDQIGGVYTMQEVRRNGIAYQLLYALLEKILLKKQTVSLFVKKINTPAISLYLKLGFRIRDNFSISYY